MSMGRPATDKRQRLVAAAIEEFHRNGYARTSLADVAKAAGLSTGNVFYYFKAKDDLARAVVDAWCILLAGYLADLDCENDPWRRMVGFINQARVMRELYVTLGCPLAGLTRDLRREGDTLKGEVARIYGVQLQWLATQFVQGGASSTVAEKCSRELMTQYHGAILLAYTQGDVSFIDQETARLKKWLRLVQDEFVPKP